MAHDVQGAQPQPGAAGVEAGAAQFAAVDLPQRAAGERGGGAAADGEVVDGGGGQAGGGDGAVGAAFGAQSPYLVPGGFRLASGRGHSSASGSSSAVSSIDAYQFSRSAQFSASVLYRHPPG